MASRRFQSVSPTGLESPEFIDTRVIPFSFTLGRLPGRNDAAAVACSLGKDNEQNAANRHADHPFPLFAVVEAIIDSFEAEGIQQRRNRVFEGDAVFEAVRDGFGVVSLEFHSTIIRQCRTP